jgi:uncharacterized protein
MASGLLALLDDVAALSKIASSSLDDVAKMAAKAGGKAAGLLIDDAAVTPRYVVGFASERELPIIYKIARGSLINKLLYLLPGALLLSTVAPWSITPLLIVGGAYLSYEGFGKVRDMLRATKPSAEAGDSPVQDSQSLEREKVASAIRTDFILSAEIMAITLATVGESSFGMKATVLAVVGLGITIAVYGTVALIVKADDFGMKLAQRRPPWSAIGRGLVRGMPHMLSLLSFVGTLAMLWVGGGIVLHGVAEYGLSGPEYGIKKLGAGVGESMPWAGGLVEWLVVAFLSGLVGLAIGAIVAPVKKFVLSRLKPTKAAP